MKEGGGWHHVDGKEVVSYWLPCRCAFITGCLVKV
jgi:hypothetical protein